MILSTVEMHTGGEPTRIIVEGWPAFTAKTLLDKRREAKERFEAAATKPVPKLRPEQAIPDADALDRMRSLGYLRPRD